MNVQNQNKIQVFEHERLCVREKGFSGVHLDALLKLNENHEGVYFEAISKGIKFNQYVAVIQVDGLTIEPLKRSSMKQQRYIFLLLLLLVFLTNACRSVGCGCPMH